MVKRLAIAAIVVALALLMGRAQAIFAVVWEPVPTNRLFANVGKYVRGHPNDARGHYTLGRLHAMVYSMGTRVPDKLVVVAKGWKTGKPTPLPDFARYDSVRVTPPAVSGKLPETLRMHLASSLGEYRWAVTMAPNEPLYLLGYAWMLEQGAPHTAEVPETAKEAGLPATEDAFRQRALETYRRAYSLTVQKELAAAERDLNAGDHSIATEAGEGILSILVRRPRKTTAEKEEQTRVKREIAEIGLKPGWITPIILSIRSAAGLHELLSSRTTHFDLAAEGRPGTWPWVKPDTGILVWDPDRTGKIVSGRQLFGSRTWQMIWRNGYEALAALDDDGNGWLEGRELAGIAIWFDRNGNGRSDPGEVVPVSVVGVTRIAVRPDGDSDGVPWVAAGVEFADGRRLPTWDWTPSSLAAPPRSRPDVQTWN